MIEQTNLVPRRRFREFQDTQAWEQRKLGELCDEFQSGKYIKAEDISDEDRYPVFGGNGLRGYTNTYNHDGLFALIGRQGALCGNMNIFQGKAYFTEHAIAVKSNKNNETRFLFYLLGEMNLGQYSGQSAQPGLAVNKLIELSAFIPSFTEQAQISAFFKQLDNLITLHQRKLDKAKALKSAYLSEMFPAEGESEPKRRFAGFTDAWELRRLGDTDTFFTDGNYGESYPSERDMSDSFNGVPFLRGSNLKNGFLDVSNSNYITKEKHEKLTSGHLEFDDIVIAVRGSLGALGYAKIENIDWNINSQLAIIRTDKKELLGLFLIQYLLGNRGQKELLSRNTGTALKQLPINQLKDVPIPIPTLNEQARIGDFFKQLDDTITLHQRKLEKLQNIKKAYLNEMFV